MVSFAIVRFFMKFFIFDFANLSLDTQGLIFALCVLFDIGVFVKAISGGKS